MRRGRSSPAMARLLGDGRAGACSCCPAWSALVGRQWALGESPAGHRADGGTMLAALIIALIGQLAVIRLAIGPRRERRRGNRPWRAPRACRSVEPAADPGCCRFAVMIAVLILGATGVIACRREPRLRRCRDLGWSCCWSSSAVLLRAVLMTSAVAERGAVGPLAIAPAQLGADRAAMAGGCSALSSCSSSAPLIVIAGGRRSVADHRRLCARRGRAADGRRADPLSGRAAGPGRGRCRSTVVMLGADLRSARRRADAEAGPTAAPEARSRAAGCRAGAGRENARPRVCTAVKPAPR